MWRRNTTLRGGEEVAVTTWRTVRRVLFGTVRKYCGLFFQVPLLAQPPQLSAFHSPCGKANGQM
jgi:hypothetical protein